MFTFYILFGKSYNIYIHNFCPLQHIQCFSPLTLQIYIYQWKELTEIEVIRNRSHSRNTSNISKTITPQQAAI